MSLEVFNNVFWNDNLLTFGKSLGFLKDEKFKRLVDNKLSFKSNSPLFEESVSCHSWRYHTLVWASRIALRLDGDFVECGTYLGSSASIICNYFNFNQIDKTFYLYDSFEGLDPQQNIEKSNLKYNQSMDVVNKMYQLDSGSAYDYVKKRFSNYENVKITKGFLPGSLNTCIPEKVSFLHLDLNAAKPEYECLKILFDKLVPGAVVVYDDYGWDLFEEQKQKADYHAKQFGYSILELPTGQGLFIKPS